MAFVFARYANQLWPLPAGAWSLPLWAATLVVVLTLINILGVQSGRWTQNILTVAKMLGLLAIVSAAFFSPAASAPASARTPQSSTRPHPRALHPRPTAEESGWEISINPLQC